YVPQPPEPCLIHIRYGYIRLRVWICDGYVRVLPGYVTGTSRCTRDVPGKNPEVPAKKMYPSCTWEEPG
ncbi:hypothetical protein KI387_001035, partial [Taxus chinensis]